MGRDVRNNANVSGVLVLPCSLGAEYGRLVCSDEETKIVYSLLSCVQHMLLKGILDCHGN